MEPEIRLSRLETSIAVLQTEQKHISDSIDELTRVNEKILTSLDSINRTLIEVSIREENRRQITKFIFRNWKTIGAIAAFVFFSIFATTDYHPLTNAQKKIAALKNIHQKKAPNQKKHHTLSSNMIQYHYAK